MAFYSSVFSALSLLIVCCWWEQGAGGKPGGVGSGGGEAVGTGSTLWQREMVIARMNCFPFLVNVNKDAASCPIWMTHALEELWDERRRSHERLSLGLLEHLCFVHLLELRHSPVLWGSLSSRKSIL